MNQMPKSWLRICGILILLVVFYFMYPTSCPNGCIIRPHCATLIKGVIRPYTINLPAFYAPDFNGYDDQLVWWFLGDRWFCSIEEAENAGWRDAMSILP